VPFEVAGSRLGEEESSCHVVNGSETRETWLMPFGNSVIWYLSRPTSPRERKNDYKQEEKNEKKRPRPVQPSQIISNEARSAPSRRDFARNMNGLLALGGKKGVRDL
jgi:hypothetical protein